MLFFYLLGNWEKRMRFWNQIWLCLRLKGEFGDLAIEKIE